jgi:hypothetical protein
MIRNRDYISWSQYDLFNKSPREYWKKYALNEDRSANKYFSKGEEFAKTVEGEETSDEILKAIMHIVPKFSQMEHKVEVALKNGEKMLCILDSCDELETKFYEYKTGKIPWNQIRAEKHEQLLFYALALYIKSERKVIPHCVLSWIETEEIDGKLEYTGNVEQFAVGFTKSKLERFEDKVIKTIEAIEDFIYEELELDEDLTNRYLELQILIKEAEQEVQEIRDKIQAQLDLSDMKYGVSETCKFTLSEQVRYAYSGRVMKLENEQKAALAKIKSEEVENGIALKTTSKVLRFSLNKN